MESKCKHNKFECILNTRLKKNTIHRYVPKNKNDEAALTIFDFIIDDILRKNFLFFLTGDSNSGIFESLQCLWNRTSVDKLQFDVESVFEFRFKSYGLRFEQLNALYVSIHPAVRNLQKTITKLYHDFSIRWITYNSLEIFAEYEHPDDETKQSPIFANASIFGDSFEYHADMASKFNSFLTCGSQSPLHLSIIIYLNPKWICDWGGETLFLDFSCGTGLFVIPKPGRAVIMDQNLVHKVGSPSYIAKKARFSMVWKLALHKIENRSYSKISEKLTYFRQNDKTIIYGLNIRLRKAHKF